MILNRILEKRNMSQYRLWKVSGVPQATISDICTEKTENRNRPGFELFKSNMCHLLRDMEDLPFLAHVLAENQIRDYFENGWHPEALYLLAMLDYVSRMNEIPLCKNYNDIRKFKLEEPLFPADVLVLCKALGNDRPKEECMCNAIPEFVRFNIIECDVRNIC